MSDLLGRLANLDLGTGLLGLPSWAVGAAGALLALIGLLAFSRAGRGRVIGAAARVALVMIGAGLSWAVLDGVLRSDVAAERRALDARAHELLTRAAMPGSALTCLDAIAGDTVEVSCEAALFQTPEATAAAVSYVSAQLTLLAAFAAHAERPGAGVPAMLGNLRRAVESDRFGLVARVLAVRDNCAPDACAAFALLNDTSHIAANLAGRTYDLVVARHASAWPAVAKSAVATQTPAVAPGTMPTPSSGAGLFFPSSASIPPVTIMDSEPSAPADTTAAVSEPSATTPTPPRRPAQSGGGGSAQPNRPAR
jgi:hypothetical protein